MRLAPYLFYVLLFTIPFGTRKLLYQFTFGLDEYEAIWLYVSDTALLFFILAALWELYKKEDREVPGRVGSALAVLAVCAFLSVLFAPLPLLALSQAVRLIALMIFALALEKLAARGAISRKLTFAIIGILAATESVIAFLQFFNQKSLNLSLLGESVLGQQVGGAAKIIVEGAKLVRGYGTFPHPNVLGAFLCMGLISLSYLFVRNMNRTNGGRIFGRFLKLPRVNSETVLILIGLDLVLFGLVLTFSRAAWAVACVSIVLFFISMWRRRKEHGVSAASLAVLFIALSIFSGTIFYKMSWAIFPRAQVTSGEPAVSYRLAYNELGIKLLKSHPFGVGIGNSVFFAVKNELYQKMGMREVWQWQPIHNIYLLMAAEIGVIGLMSFLVLIAIVLFIKNLSAAADGTLNFELGTSKIMLCTLLLFGLVDHFLWTLEPGRLMLWLAIGLAMGFNGVRKPS